MEAPSPTYILTRSIYLIVLIIAVIFGYGFVKKRQRINAITSGLQSITSDSSFFKQFYAQDARKSLVRAIGLIAEANAMGVDPEITINRGLGIKEKFYATDSDFKDPVPRETVIRTCLRSNYENFLKLGYKTDPQTIASLKEGSLPAIPSGPHAGNPPEIANLINPAICTDMDKMIANLEIRPPQNDNNQLTDTQVAAAKQLAHDLTNAGIIEESVCNRILTELSKSPNHPAP